MSAGDYSRTIDEQNRYRQALMNEQQRIDRMTPEEAFKYYRRQHQYDPNNVPGSILAKLGRAVLSGEQMAQPKPVTRSVPYGDKPSVKLSAYPSMTNIDWLNRRVQEVCEKGKL